ncbi:PREDICTED: protease Do-like 5, chloroplastic [Camelina sativa]|uniref:Protease Do-like 5, chloroplastic n=1 Tax=Camelina sativa TaxID=90675 RepID=A0ABM0UE78_CAMSA|nr:PREDICTED: protease Do-like 5, chloroplastic [Camelina sativa]
MSIALASSKAFSSIFYTVAPINRSNFVLACSGSNHIDVVDRRRRRIVIFGSSLALASTLLGSNLQILPVESAIAMEKLKEKEDELEEEEDRNVNLFQKTSSSVVYIEDIELPKTSSGDFTNDEENAKIEGTGSGFVWDKLGHIVTNYHVIAKLATDQIGLQRCKVSLVEATGTRFTKDGKIVGLDPDNDLAVLKIETEGRELNPVVLGTSNDLRVGQSCYAIGNPYGYENTLTIGVVSGLGREIPSPNGKSIREAIQTDADINSGNSGGPLLDSYGHTIGVNTATFTRKGSGMSSGVNFAIPIDTVVRTVPYLIVYGTAYRDRF